MFIDKAKIFVRAGKGGNGVVSFRHEIYVDKGGPDGGDGGRGGDVYVKGTDNLNTLAKFRYNPKILAEDGANGAKAKKRGKSGEDLIINVPIGTVITSNGQILADITKKGQKVLIAHGGDGGYGNAHFKSSTRQAPKFAENGEMGDEFEANIELKMIADIGIVGLPNAGKSTFLSVVSNAKPEIASYQFTTLIPNLGVSYFGEDSILFADIPGLIKGASIGKGLGHTFLKHIERTSIILHLIDVYSDDIIKSYKIIRDELKKYSQNLDEKIEVIALTKCEGVDKKIIDKKISDLKKSLKNDTPIFAISSQAKLNIKTLLAHLLKTLKENKEIELDNVEEENIPQITIEDNDENDWDIEVKDDIFIVRGKKIEKFAKRTVYNNPESVNRLKDILNKMGISHQLLKLGANKNSTIKILDYSINFFGNLDD